MEHEELLRAEVIAACKITFRPEPRQGLWRVPSAQIDGVWRMFASDPRDYLLSSRGVVIGDAIHAQATEICESLNRRDRR